MSKVQIDGVEYDTNRLSDHAKSLLVEVKKIDERIQENQNMSAILTKAKRAYIADLKREMLTAKSGMLLDDE